MADQEKWELSREEIEARIKEQNSKHKKKGKVQKVKIRFSNHLANVVIDRFGKDITMIPEDEKHFTIHTEGFPKIQPGKRIVIPKDKLLDWLNNQIK